MPRTFFNKLRVSNLFPKLNMLPNILAPCCVLCFLCRLGPIVHILFIVTFAGKSFSTYPFISCYKVRLSGKVTRCGVTFCLNNICLYTYLLRLCFLPPNIFFITTSLNEHTKDILVKIRLFVYVYFFHRLYTKHLTLAIAFSF